MEAKLEWTEAEIHCQGEGGHLASVHSAEENNFLSGLDPNELWLGGTDSTSEGTWTWSDGTILSFTGWKSGQPDDMGGNQDCLYTNNHGAGAWDDLSCTIELKLICKITYV